MMRILAGLLVMFVGFTASASLGQDDVHKGIVGKYILQVDNDSAISFLIRSSGKIQVLNQNDQYEYVSGEMIFAGSNNDWGMSGLPIAHIVLGDSSDEEARDFHILITVQQEWDEDAKDVIVVVGMFETFNDGPNGYSMAEGASYKLKKYNKKTKKYDLLN